MKKLFKDLERGERFLYTDRLVNVGAKLVLMKIKSIRADDLFGNIHLFNFVCIEGVAVGTMGTIENDILVEVVSQEYSLQKATCVLNGVARGIWSGNHVIFSVRGKEHRLTTEINIPGNDNPVTIFCDGNKYFVIDEDGHGINILPNYNFDEFGVSH